jgi:geranylgeranyl reductase family protein
MTEPVYDVAIVGAGPAGTVAAYQCARQGLRTVLLEKEQLPRRKVCGGGLSAKSLGLLPFSPDAVMEQRTVSGWVAYGHDRALEVQVQRPGMMVCRESFDAFLAEQAVAAGARLVECFDLELVERHDKAITLVPRMGQKIEARFLIAADGVNSVVRHRLFPRSHPRTVAALEARVVPAAWAGERMADRCLFDFGAVEAGYGWIFPKRDHFNVGVYRFRKTPASRDLRAVLTTFLAGNPFLREARVLDVAGATIPVSPGAGSVVRGRVILAGDAAGLGDALYGEGIYSALRSGMDAAASVVADLTGNAPLTVYDERIHGLRRQLRAAALIAAFVYRFPRFAFERMAGSPYASRLFSGVITGEVSPAQCLFKATASAPYWILARRERANVLPSR